MDFNWNSLVTKSTEAEYIWHNGESSQRLIALFVCMSLIEGRSSTTKELCCTYIFHFAILWNSVENRGCDWKYTGPNLERYWILTAECWNDQIWSKFKLEEWALWTIVEPKFVVVHFVAISHYVSLSIHSQPCIWLLVIASIKWHFQHWTFSVYLFMFHLMTSQWFMTIQNHDNNYWAIVARNHTPSETWSSFCRDSGKMNFK